MPLRLLNESAIPSAMIVVVACSVEEAVRRAWRVTLFCSSRLPAVKPPAMRQVPEMEKQPPLRSIPPANVEVPVPLMYVEFVPTLRSPCTLRLLNRVDVPLVKLATFWMERMEPGVVVPIPTRPLVSMVKAAVVEVASASLEVPTYKLPPMLLNSQCLRFALAEASVSANEGRVPATCRFQLGLVVPMPKKLLVPSVSVEVAVWVFVSEKYASCPMVPEMEDAPPRHVLFTEKQPPERSMPLANVLVAREPVILSAFVWMPFEKVDVAEPFR